MAKKKTGRQFIESHEERIVSEEFDCAVKIIKKQPMRGNAARYFDLHGETLRRRKTVALAYMDQIKARYAEKHKDLDVVSEWALHCSIATQTYEQTDQSNHITLAAAIWMLDELKHSGRLKDAFQFFYKEPEALETFYLPDFFDAWHDDSVIRGMMHLIRHRDNCEKPNRHFINEITAARTKPIVSENSASTDSGQVAEAELGPRERFNAVMDMIHPEIKQRAIQRFEKKQWEFLDGLFACGEILEIEESKAVLEIERLLEEGKSLQKTLDEERKRAAGIPIKNRFPVAAPNMATMPSFDGVATPSIPAFAYGPGANDTISRLRRIADKGMAFQDKADDLSRQHADLQFLSPIAPLYGRKALERDLRPEIVDRLLSFEVNDPYETCFAFLCLIEEGADAAWLYNTNLAVLSAAARKLPWANNIHTREDYEWDEDDEDAPGDEDADEVDLDDVIPSAPLDWNSKKAFLYELKYKDDLEFFPEKSDRKDWKLNIPQMVYTLTGLVMPRTVSDYDELASEFVDAGMDPAAASILELYLQLASDVQCPSKDWEAFLQSSRFQRINEIYGEEEPDAEADAEDDADVDVDALREQIRTLKEKNDELRQMLYTATKEAENQRDAAKRVLDEAANEHQELLDLRELIYNQANSQDKNEVETEDHSIGLPYNTVQRIVVFGGHDTWLKAIKPLLPNIVFVNREQNPNAEMIRAADVVWIQANALSHKNYYKIINIVRTYRIPVRYFGYASARKCAEQLVREDLKR